MSFRRAGAASHAWQQWVAKNRDTLLRCGISNQLIRSERDWVYFVGHGEHPQFAFAVTDLGSGQAKILLEFLRAEYGDDGGVAWVAVKDLERRS